MQVFLRITCFPSRQTRSACNPLRLSVDTHSPRPSLLPEAQPCLGWALALCGHYQGQERLVSPQHISVDLTGNIYSFFISLSYQCSHDFCDHMQIRSPRKEHRAQQKKAGLIFPFLLIDFSLAITENLMLPFFSPEPSRHIFLRLLNKH